MIRKICIVLALMVIGLFVHAQNIQIKGGNPDSKESKELLKKIKDPVFLRNLIESKLGKKLDAFQPKKDDTAKKLVTAKKMKEDLMMKKAEIVSEEFKDILFLLDKYYVEEVDLVKLRNVAIDAMLKSLDPHTRHARGGESRALNATIKAQLCGVGIGLTIINDTTRISYVYENSPAEKAGLRINDRIIAVDGVDVCGAPEKYRDITEKIIGKKNTAVALTIKRRGEKTIDINPIRSKVEIPSMCVYKMLTKDIGYIKFSRFAITTGNEVKEAAKKLKEQGMKDIIIDLQGNAGGAYSAAISICDEIITEGKLLNYVKGKISPEVKKISKPGGLLEDARVILLVNEGSASASEVLSGCIQDWERGLLVGRRTYGKGLMQMPVSLTDSSQLLVTYRYLYTPAGRCIQKKYDKGVEEYENELMARYQRGELFDKSKIKIKKDEKCYTKMNRKEVYGGNALMPDVFVPLDSTINLLAYNKIITYMLSDYIYDYIDVNINKLKKKYKSFKRFINKFEVDEELMQKIFKRTYEDELTKGHEINAAEEKLLRTFIKSSVAKVLFGMSASHEVNMQNNDALDKALELLQNGEYERILNN